MIDEEVDAPLVVEETPKEEGRERKMTSKGEGFQRDFLTKEYKRQRKNLTQTIGLFEDLLRSKDVEATERELKNLQKSFADFKETACRWMDLSNEEEKREIEQMLQAEEDGFVRVEGAVKDWILGQERMDNKSYRSGHSKKSRRSGISRSSKASSRRTDRERTAKDKPTGGLTTRKVVETSEIMIKQLRLVEQVKICDDLLKSEHADMARKEQSQLQDIFEEMEGIVKSLSERLPDAEMEKVKEILNKEEVEVNRIKVMVEEKFPCNDDGIQSCHSHASQRSVRSKGSSKTGLPKKTTLVQQANHRMIGETNEVTMTKYRKLEEQLKVCEVLGEAEDAMVVKREVAVLENVLKEIKDTIAFPREGLGEEEERKIEDTIAKGTAELDKLKARLEVISRKRNDEAELEGLNVPTMQIREALREPSKPVSLINKALSNHSGLARRHREGDRMSQKSAYSLQSGGSKVSKRSSCKSQEEELSEEILTSQWTKTQERLESQRLHMEELFKMNDVEMMQRELNILEQIHQTLVTLSQRLSQGVPQERANKIFDQILEHDETVFAMKKEVIRWMIALDERDRRSSASRSSKRTGMSDVSLLSGGKKTMKDKIKPNEENMNAQLEEEKAKLEHQKRRCSEVMNSRDANTMRKEMKALDSIYRNVSHKVTEIHELLPQLEADMMMEWVTEEDDRIFQLKQQMIRSMTSKIEHDDTLKKETPAGNERIKLSPISARDNSKGNYGNHDIQPSTRKEVEDRARLEVEIVQQRLGEQRDLVEHLLKADDMEIVNQEMETLDRVYDDMVAAASHLRKILPIGEADNVSTMLDAQDNHVFKLKNKVANWMSVCVKKSEDPEDLKKGMKIKKSSEQKLKNRAVELKSADEKTIEHSREIEALKAEVENMKMRNLLQKDRTNATAEDYAKTQDRDDDLAALRIEIDSIKSGEVVKEKTQDKVGEDKELAAENYTKTRQQDKELAALRAEIESIKSGEGGKEITGNRGGEDKNLAAEDHAKTEKYEKELAALKAEIKSIKSGQGVVEETRDKVGEAKKLAAEDHAKTQKYDRELAALKAEIKNIKIGEDVEGESLVIVGEEKQNLELAVLKAEVQAMKEQRSMIREKLDDARTGNKTVEKKDKGKVAGIDEEEEGKVKESNSIEESARLIRLNESMVETLKLSSAPKVEIDSFAGDPLEYNYFIETFKDVVENVITDPRQRLIRLLKYTKGDAKDLIKNCILDDSTDCYEAALNLLKQEYGNPFHIACAHVEKLKKWPQIKANDAAGIKHLYRFLVRCVAFQKIGALDLDSPLVIRNVQLTLPLHLQDKWTGKVAKIRKKGGEEAKFTDFLKFVQEESEVLNDPVYSRGGFKEKKFEEKQVKVNATEVLEETEVIKKETAVCPLCKINHDLDDCVKFKELDVRAKKDLMFANKLCFSCYGKGHQIKGCDDKRTCTICGSGHPTGLHEVKFKIHAIHQGDRQGGMCIVPVRVRHENSPGIEVEMYAMLDECCTGTFITEDMINILNEEAKQPTRIKITTATDRDGVIEESFSVKGLVVKCGREHNKEHESVDVKLPTTYTKNGLPMDKDDVPRVGDFSEWPYLQEMFASFPGLKDIPFGMLIGSNCPKALEPMQVIPSQEDGPYAKRTRLGWCVVGGINEEDGPRVTCNGMKVVSSIKDLSTGTSKGHQLILQTKVEDNSIAEALKEMWRTDFVERAAEEEALSKEDKMFLSMMKENVCFKNGHYELPLPVRTEMPLVSSKEHDLRPEGSTESSTGEERPKMTEVSQGQSSHHPEDQDTQKDEQNKCKEEISILPSSEAALLQEDGKDKAVNKTSFVVMPRNREQALQRSKGVCRRMLKDESFRKDYMAFMTKLIERGYARKVPIDRLAENAWFLPHHGVRHPTKKKLRVVFDCSATKEGVSLNSKLIQGPEFTKSLVGVLLRFRKGSIPLMADIESMYYQVHIPEADRKFVRFFWWEENDLQKEPVEFEMCVHPFGAISSKSCVTFALHQAALDNQKVFGPEAAEALREDFYVDDLLKSMDDVDMAIDMVKNIHGMCAAGGFNLTKFVSSNHRVIESIPVEDRAEGLREYVIGGDLPVESALGTRWNMKNDTFGFRVNLNADNGTRRGCLATISRVKDSLGLGAPFVLKGRKILQKMTAEAVAWDEHIGGMD